MQSEMSGGFSAVNENEVSVVGVKENGDGRDDRRGGVNTSILMCSVVCDKNVEVKGNGNAGVDRVSYGGDAANVDERNGYVFLVGDLVWGKIRNQPWMPGLIYDPADASDMALRYRIENNLLVGYFGDGSCSWCSPSQVVPFVENYEEMSKQSSSNGFVHAVEEALKELGRRVELKMICSCVSEGDLIDLARPEAMNAAVRPGILVPNGAIDKVPSPWCEPAEILSYLRNVALSGSSNWLEVVLMKSWLAAFSRLKKGRSLIIYREPQPIEGLEDKIKDAVLDTTGFSFPTLGPFEEERSGSPKTPRVKGRKRNMTSVAKLMGEDNADINGKKKDKIAAKTPSTTSRNNKAGTDDDIEESDIQQSSTAGRMTGGRKKIDNSDSHANVVHDGFQIERVGNESIQSLVLKKDEDPVDHIDEGSDELTLKRNISRIKKISKYLCEPYIFLPPKLRMTGRKKIDNSDSHAILVSDGFQIERVDNESTQSIVLKKDEDPVDYIGEGSDELTLKRYISRIRKNNKYFCEPDTLPSPKLRRSYCKRQPETKFDKIVKSASVGDHLTEVEGQLVYSPSFTKSNSAVSAEEMSVANSQNFNEISASANQVAGEVLSEAADISLMDGGSIEPLRGFVSAIRSAAYLNTCNNQLCQEQNSGKKRKVSVYEPGDMVTDLDTPADVKINKPRSRVTKLKSAARASQVVDIAPKDNVNLTSMLNQCDGTISVEDMVTDLNTPADVSAQPVAHSVNINEPRSRLTKLKKAARASQVVDIVRKDIMNMTSMLNQCDGTISAEEKSTLECEIKSMLQNVIDLEVKASS